MKKSIIALCTVAAILTSCGGSETKTDAAAADSLKVDSTKVEVLDTVAVTVDTAASSTTAVH
jgi:hypothetical protein